MFHWQDIENSDVSYLTLYVMFWNYICASVYENLH